MGRGSGTGSDCLQGTDLGRRCLTPRYAAPAGWERPDGLADRSTLEGGPTDHYKQPWPHEVADSIPLQASSSTPTTAPGTPPMRSGGRVARFTSPSRWERSTATMATPWLSRSSRAPHDHSLSRLRPTMARPTHWTGSGQSVWVSTR